MSVVIAAKEDVVSVKRNLLRIEKESGKRLAKWKKTHPRVRERFLKEVLNIGALKKSVFYASYQNRKDYITLTGSAVAKAILQKAESDYSATIYVHGFNPAEAKKVIKELKKFRVKYRKVRGMRESSDVLIRLADALVGFVRDWQEGKKYAQALFKEFQERKLVLAV